MSDSITPTLPEIGQELRCVVKHLNVVASHVVVCTKALEQQAADEDVDVAVVLRQTVGVSLYSQTSRLARLAARCDGKPVDDDYLPDEPPSDGTDEHGDDKGEAP
jgi:hypothetical protein